jgi:chemotaxis methyl-accepting protein methylase
LGCAGLDAAAYRAQTLHRRLPACLRGLKVRSTRAARELVEQEPGLVPTVVSSLLIGVTEFFREPDVFDRVRTHICPALADRKPPLRIWSAACSTGAELYSMAVLLADSGLLERSFLLGTDCRGDAIENAKLGLYNAAALSSVPDAARRRYFERAGPRWRPVEALRGRTRWKAANLLAGVEHGPWDIILWRNAAIYLKPERAESIWRRLASVLAAEGVLIVGKAERPPKDLGLKHVGRCTYRMAEHAAEAGSKRGPPSSRTIGNNESPMRVL